MRERWETIGIEGGKGDLLEAVKCKCEFVPPVLLLESLMKEWTTLMAKRLWIRAWVVQCGLCSVHKLE